MVPDPQSLVSKKLSGYPPRTLQVHGMSLVRMGLTLVLDGGRGKNGNDVSEIAGPGYSSPGPDPPETRQTAFGSCPLASRLSQTLASASRPFVARAHRCLRQSALIAPFPRLLTGGCIPDCRVSRMDARRRLAAGQHARTLPGRCTAPWLAMCMHIHFTHASTVPRLNLHPLYEYCSPCLRPCRCQCMRLHAACSLFRRGRHLTCFTHSFILDDLRFLRTMPSKFPSCSCNRACSCCSVGLIIAHICRRF
jgi:hypothetical protein